MLKKIVYAGMFILSVTNVKSWANENLSDLSHTQLCNWALDYQGDWIAYQQLTIQELNSRDLNCARERSQEFAKAYETYQAGDKTAAIDLFRVAYQKNGSRTALANLGGLLWGAAVTETEKQDALKFMKIAAQYGDENRQYFLLKFYMDGKEVEQDY